MNRTVAAVAVFGLFLWFFGPVLCGSQSFAYRDAANYYYPLFEWIDLQWRAGQIPLWNPHENCGLPVVGDASSSMFYPGKLLFALPLSFAVRYKLYISLHILVAALTSFLLARQWKASTLAATLCAVSYAYSGNVLFHYCNVIFLVGAAWLPLAILAADRVLFERRASWSLVLGLALALQTLGGDPQSAYMSGLLILLYWALLRRAERKAGAIGPAHDELDVVRSGHPSSRTKWQSLLCSRASCLLLAATAGGCLAAVQVLPAFDWARRSERRNFDAPPSIYAIPSAIRASTTGTGRADAGTSPRILDGLLGTPPPDSSARNIYQFSVGPWRLVEFFWPNVSGRPFPTHRRWIAALPAESLSWTPSLYAGLLPVVLAVSTCRLRRTQVRIQWMSWSLLLSVLGSFGWFGIGFVIREVRSLCGLDPGPAGLGPQVGGLYWWLVVFLPGFSQFRYPAKLLVIAQLALSLLAGWGWDRAIGGEAAKVRRVLLGLAATSVLGAVATLAIRPFALSWLAQTAPDTTFGPLDAWGASNDILFAMLHTGTLSIALHWLLAALHRTPRLATWMPRLAVLLTAAELGAAHHWLLPTVPDATFTRNPEVAAQLAALDGRPDQQRYRTMRGARAGWQPSAWSRESSATRLDAVVRWEQDTLLPRYQLRADMSLIESTPSIMSTDFSSFLAVARRHGWQRTDGAWEPHPGALVALTTRYWIQPEGLGSPSGTTRSVAATGTSAAPEHTEIWALAEPFPRAWIVHRVERLPPLTDDRPAAVRLRVENGWFPQGMLRDLRRVATVETELPVELQVAEALPTAAESCQLSVDLPNRVELDATLATPGLVVLNDTFDPGWEVDVHTLASPDRESDDSRPSPALRTPVLRTNRIMRGVVLPAGKHRLVYRYRPRPFWIGAAISSVGWCLLLAISIFRISTARPWRRLVSARTPSTLPDTSSPAHASPASG